MRRGGRAPFTHTINIKIKIHFSSEDEDFVETHLCKLCDTYSDRAYTGCVTSLRI